MNKLSRILRQILFIGLILNFSTTLTFTSENDILYESPLSQEDLAIGTRQGFHTVKLPDCISTDKVGSPEMPLKVLQFAINDKNAEYTVEILNDEKTVIPGAFYVYPSQQPCPTNAEECPFTEPDQDVYQSAASYPAARVALVKKGTLSGVDVATVHVYPLEYIPTEGKLILHTNIKFRLVEKTSSKGLRLSATDQRAQQRIISSKSVISRNVTKQFFHKVLANPEVVDARLDAPGSSDQPDSWTLFMNLNAPSGPVDYLIITNRDLKTSGVFQPLLDSRTDKGLTVWVEAVEDIRATMSGRDTPEKMRNYIRELQQNNGLTYVLLGGDTNIVPVRYALGEKVISDMYFSDLDGDWDSNGDGNFAHGDVLDLYPDVFVGRAPVGNRSEAETFVDKVLTYEDNISDYKNSALFFAASDWGDLGGRSADRIYRNYIPENFNTLMYYERDIAPYAAQAQAAMDRGYHLVNHNDHGNKNLMVFGSGDTTCNADGSDCLSNGDIDRLRNDSAPSVFYSTGCYVAAIDDDCIAEHFITNPNGGGVAFIGNSLLGWSIPGTDLNEIFYESLFNDGITIIGQTLAYLKLPFIGTTHDESIYQMFELNLLGDPAMNIVIGDEPGAITDLSAISQDARVTLSWTPPDDNGSPIINYRLEYGTVDSNQFDNVLDYVEPGVTIPGLDNGVEYQFRVMAENMVGWSPASNVAMVIPHAPSTAYRPAPITNLIAAGGDAEVRLNWTAQADNGSPVLRYIVQYGLENGPLTETLYDDADPGYTVTGLTNGVTYQFQVKAENAVGTSRESNIATATPKVIKKADVRWVNAQGVEIDGNSLTKITYTQWGNSGAASAQSFEGDGGMEFTAMETNTYRVCGLSSRDKDAGYASIEYGINPRQDGTLEIYENGGKKSSAGTYATGDVLSVERVGTTVYYKKNGEEVYQSTIHSSGRLLVDAALYDPGATIANAKIFGSLFDVPGEIADLKAESGDGEVYLTWTAPANNGLKILRYKVQYGTVASGGFGTAVTDEDGPGTTIPGLMNGTAYQFRVYAENALGAGPLPEDPVTATPNKIPASDVIWINAVGVEVNGNSLKKTSGTGMPGGAASSQTIPGDGGVTFTLIEQNLDRACGLSSQDRDPWWDSIDYAIYAHADGVLMVIERGEKEFEYVIYKSGDTVSVERKGNTIYYKKNGSAFYVSRTPSHGPLLADAGMYHQGSTISNAKIFGITPAVPAMIDDLQAESGDGEVTLAWTEPVNNGSPILRYIVQYGTKTSGQFDKTVTDEDGPGITIPDLINGTAYQFRVCAENAIGAGPLQEEPVIATPNKISVSDVTWINAVGVEVTGNSLTKTAGDNWGNGGAASSHSLSGDGRLEFTVTETNTYRMCGLSSMDKDAGYTSIEYALFPRQDGTLQVYENGEYKKSTGTYQPGDLLAIERHGTQVYYKKNRIVVYKSPTASSGPLLVDAALHDQGSTITNAKLIINLSAPGQITDLSAEGQDGKVKLTWTPPAENGSPILRYIVKYGTEAGGEFDKTLTDDAVPGITVPGLTNGIAYQFLVYAENALGAGPVQEEPVIATPDKVSVSDVIWINAVGVEVNGNSLTKTAGDNWGNGGAASAQSFSGDGKVEFTVTETSTYRMCGLSSGDNDADFHSIAYAFHPRQDGTLRVYENGENKKSVGTYQSGDVLVVERLGTTVYYKKNEALLYESTKPSSGPLLVDAALYNHGSTITDAKIFETVQGGVVPGTITGLKATSDIEQITLDWDARPEEEAVAGYNVYYAPVSRGTPRGSVLSMAGNFVRTLRLGSPAVMASETSSPPESAKKEFTEDTTFTISGITVQHQFWVEAVNDSGVSESAFITAWPWPKPKPSPSPSATPEPDASPTPPPVQKQNVQWIAPKGVEIHIAQEGVTLIKTAPTGWDTGSAVSSQILEGNGGVEFTASERTTYRMCGLSPDGEGIDAPVDPDQEPVGNQMKIAYGILLRPDRYVAVYEKGVWKGKFMVYQEGDVFAVERIGTTIAYEIKRKGTSNFTTFYVSRQPAEGPLRVNAALYTEDATLKHARLYTSNTGSY